jgi:hypothetical protein
VPGFQNFQKLSEQIQTTIVSKELLLKEIANEKTKNPTLTFRLLEMKNSIINILLG